MPNIIAPPQQFKGEHGKKYKVISGALRTSGGVWGTIEDAAHTSTNIDSLSLNGSLSLRLNYGFSAEKVSSLIVTPDETYANAGYDFGASVGLTYADIYAKVNKRVGGYVYYTGTAWNIGYTKGVSSVDFTNGILTITHDNFPMYYPDDLFNASVNTRDGAFIPQVGSLGTNTMEVKFYDYAGNLATTPTTGMKIYVDRHIEGICNIDDVEIGGANIWVYGVMEV